MKKLTIVIMMIFAFIFIVTPVYAIEHDNIDLAILPTITYIPHGIDDMGDLELSPSINQVKTNLDNIGTPVKALYIVSPTRNINFQYNINNITYTYNLVSRYEIIYDWYITSSFRQMTINLYNSSNQVIHTVTSGIGNITISPQTYIISTSTYENGFSEGLQNGFNQAKNDYGILYNGQWLTALEYGVMQRELGRNENSNQTSLQVLFGGIASLFGTGLAFVLQLGSIELMGISLNMLAGIGLLLVGLIAILGLIFGGK